MLETKPKAPEKISQEIIRRREAIRPLNGRISTLRQESVGSTVRVSGERAALITEFYSTVQPEKWSTPVRRALALKYLLERVSIPVEQGQLIVGLRGTGPNEVPTYPEISAHTMADLDTLDKRANMPYRVDGKTKELYEKKVIPFWKGSSMRDMIFSQLSKEWKDAYEAGIYTEFMEQRAPGHTAGGARIFRVGALDIKKEIHDRLASLDPTDPEDNARLEELKGMDIAADAIITYAGRYAAKLEGIAMVEANELRKGELLKMAEVCRWVPAHAPRNFWEALQHYWFVHVGVTYETNPWDAFTPGRLDQHLRDFYRRDLEEGRITRQAAKELLEAFWLKFNNQPAVPKVGVTLEESFTYNDFAKINIGGLKADGSEATNELSYLILEVLDEMRTLQPNTAVLVSNKTPERFVAESLNVVNPGFGEPPFFNFDGIIVKMLRQGKSLKDARESGVSGCVETGALGKEAYILTGYLNMPKILEITLNNGVDPRTGNQIGIPTGDPTRFTGFEELFRAFVEQLKFFVSVKTAGNDVIESLFAEHLPVPFLSLWLEDCVSNAADYNSGGAKYNTNYIQVVGLGTVADSLASLKYNIFEKKRFEMRDVLATIKADYAGNEVMRQTFLNKTPKYGNDDPYVDGLAGRVVDTAIDIIENHPPTPVRKASRRAYFLPTTAHVYFGKVTGATPDGRRAGLPVSEGVSPVQGADRKGIAAAFSSVGRIDWDQAGGALLNQKLSPDLLVGDEEIEKMARMIRAYFIMGGHHVQFNVVSAELLREAQVRPQDFQDLMVRVAGYSDYFVNLPKGLQDEIIARTEHKEF
ncbi:MAG TPA: glycyl radical protein [Nitrososphaerales archaeon]|nr:glycyl radical protein [Nitrososphaerales archaeon]